MLLLDYDAGMKRFALVLFALAILPPGARAQQDADDQYIIIYSLMQNADSLESTGQPREALNQYVEAQGELQRFQRMFPNWHTDIVSYRLGYLAQKIAEVTKELPVAGVPPVTNSPPATNSPAVGADLTAQLDSLRTQVQQLQANNTELEDKLREALAVQPVAVDPRELSAAREQIRLLMKTNSLLEVDLSQRAAGSELDQLKQAQLALVVQTERANKLEQENKLLQARLQAVQSGTDSAEAMREENEVLKKQLAQAQAAATNSAAVASLNVELAAAQKQIASLQSDLDVRQLAEEALENRIRQLRSASPTNQADNAAAVRELTQERDSLLAQLGEAKKQLGPQKQDLAAQISELTGEVNTLRARLAVDEAQVIPYTPEELALFRQPTPLPAKPSNDTMPLSQLPPDSAVLVAEAQSYFSAGQYDKAEADYEKILEHDQNNGLALANLAAIEMQQGKLDDAEKHINAALTQSPDDAYNLSILGNLKIQQGKFGDAIDVLSRAAKIDPNNPAVESFLGVALANKGLRAQAETALRRAIEIAPDYGPAQNNLAVIYINDQPPMPALARWHYEQALKDGEPRNPALEKLLAEKGAPVDQ